MHHAHGLDFMLAIVTQLRFDHLGVDSVTPVGLYYVDIYTGPGKPGGDVYIDDKAERYTGTDGAWKRLVPKVMRRLENGHKFYPDNYLKEAAGVLR